MYLFLYRMYAILITITNFNYHLLRDIELRRADCPTFWFNQPNADSFIRSSFYADVCVCMQETPNQWIPFCKVTKKKWKKCNIIDGNAKLM